MYWYSNREGQALGPVSEEELHRLAAAGEVAELTPVRAEEASIWEAYRALFPLVKPSPEAAAAAAAPASDQPLTRCSQCGQTVIADHAVGILGREVCFRCKPTFLHRLKEGVPSLGVPEWGGFWIRGGARLIDGVILWLVNTGLSLLLFMPVIAFTAGEGGEPSPFGCVLMLLVYALQIGVAAMYEIAFVVRWAATPGKMVCGLKVFSSDGARLGWGRSTGRYFANMINGFTLGVGYVMAAFDSEKKALHDMICDTRVVRVR